MIKILRFLVISACSGALASSMAWAQTYTTVDFPGATGTSLNGGPNPQGTIVGSETDTSGVIHGFTLTNGVFSQPFDPPGSTLTIPNCISPQGVIVGGYVDSSGVSHGFILKGGQYTIVDNPFSGQPGTEFTSLSPSGELTGESCSDPACGNTGSGSTNHSFVLSNGIFTSFDPPGAVSSQSSTVNAPGAIVGFYVTSDGNGHGYLLYHGTFTTLDFGADTFTFAGANNPQGDIVGLYEDTLSVEHSFLLRNGVFTSFDPPGAVFSDAAGINSGGIIVGIYFAATGPEHGYIRTP